MSDFTKRLEETLTSYYEHVVDKELKTRDTVKEKHRLFEKINARIKASIKESLDNHEKNLLAIDKQHQESLSRLKKHYQQNIATTEQTQKETNTLFKKDKKALEDDLEQKRHLNTLKEEKAANNHAFKVKAIQEARQKVQEDADRKIENAHKRYNTNIDELDHRTTIAHETNKNNLTIEDTNYSNRHQAIKEESASKTREKEKELKAKEKSIKDDLLRLKKDYKNTLEPIDKEIEKIEKRFEKELLALKAHYEEELNKNEKYLKEAEKISDTARVSELSKKIKQLKKEQVQKKSEKEKEYSDTLNPALENKQGIVENLRQKFYEAKETHTESVRVLLYELEAIKTEEYNRIDEANTTFNIAKAHFDQTKENINLDDAIQKLNYRQTDEENELFYTFEKERSVPRANLEELETTYAFDLELNTLKQALETFNTTHKKNLKIRELTHALDLEKLELEFKKMHAYFEYDTQEVHLARTSKRIHKDYEKEQMLLSHYYLQSKNYTALKADEMKQIKPMLEKELENRTKLKINHFNHLIDQAKKDHKVMQETIDAMYAHEITMYQEAYDALKKEHQEKIEHMMTRQAIERNKDLEKISVLDPKKDKNMIKRMKKELQDKQQIHDESLAVHKKELDIKLKHYSDMISSIKNAKVQSLEEADTLLNHIVDQSNESIEYMHALKTREIENYDQLYYKIKQSADLFQTFQLQRQEDTTQLASEYKRARLDKKEQESKHALSTLERTLETLNKRFAHYEEDNKKLQKEALDIYQKTVDNLNKEARDKAQDLEDEYIDEKRRLELYASKLERTYHEDLQKLRKAFKEEENYLFTQKQESEKRLEEEIERLKQNLAREHESKNAMLEEKNKDYSAKKTEILTLVKENPLTHLTEDKVTWLKAIILGEEGLEILK